MRKKMKENQNNLPLKTAKTKRKRKTTTAQKYQDKLIEKGEQKKIKTTSAQK